MLLYVVHLVCIALYFTRPYYLALFYSVLLVPWMHNFLLFHLIEKYVPPWVYLFKCTVHCLVYPDMTKRLLIVCVWFIIYLWHNIYYLIHHAEKRLGKIDSIIEHNRVAHLHYRVYPVDMTNRFHTNLFETNRLYMFNDLEEARRTKTGISNYRKMLQENKMPRSLTVEEKRMYKAAHNELIFILNRRYFLYLPPLVIFSLIGFIDTNVPTNFIVLGVEILARLCLSTYHGYILTNLTLGATIRFLLYKELIFM